MGVLQIILFLEERYQIALDDDEIVPDNLDLIQRVKRSVDRKLTAAHATELTCDNSGDVPAPGKGQLQLESFRTTAQRFPDKTALVFDRRRLTYGEIKTCANQLAHAMIDLGVQQGDRVAIWPRELA